MNKPWFDAIGMSYAQHHDEVEAARSAFVQQRTVLLERLIKAFEDSVAKTTFKTFERRTEDGWETMWLSGSYAAVRREAGTGERQSAICFGLDHDPCFVGDDGGRFGFGAYVYFKMSERRYAQLRTTMVGVAAPVDYYRDEAAAYIRGAWIVPGGERFRLDAFEEEVARLPELFVKADEAVGTAFRKLKFGKQQSDE